MMPIGPLMIEHRLIERMIALLRDEIARMERDRTIDAHFLDTFIDFLMTYADRLHHGKEEDILFSELDAKDLPPDLARIMSELREEHRQARTAVLALRHAKGRAIAGQADQLARVLTHARLLATAYPRHIEKEDRHFFLPVMRLLTDSEKNEMLEREYLFDRELLHRLYLEKVEQEEERKQRAA